MRDCRTEGREKCQVPVKVQVQPDLFSLEHCCKAAAKWLEVFFFNKKKPKQTTCLYVRGLCMPGEPLFTSSMLSIGVELIIFMLLLLQLATCRNDTSPKHSCQKFWALYLHSLTLAASHSYNSTRKRVFVEIFGMKMMSGRRGFPLVRWGCLSLGKLGCSAPWIHPPLTVHQSRSACKLTDK